jgi:hypothetical protein
MRYFKHDTILDLRDGVTRAEQAARQHLVDLRTAGANRLAGRGIEKGTEKNKAMPLVLTHVVRVLSIVFVVSSVWYVLPTVAVSLSYFTDTEAAPANSIASALLSIDADGGGTYELASGASVRIPIETELVTSRSAQYAIHTTYATGTPELCELVNAELWQGDYRHFPNGGSPDLLDVEVSHATSSGLWNLDVSLPTFASSIPDGTSCSVELVFQAWCTTTGDYGDGFSDEDRVRVTIVKSGDSVVTALSVAPAIADVPGTHSREPEILEDGEEPVNCEPTCDTSDGSDDTEDATPPADGDVDEVPVDVEVLTLE